MNEQDVLAALEEDCEIDAEDLLLAADPKFRRRWSALCRSMATFLADVQVHFPDAEYYTASGGFNLMLGRPHGKGHGQPAQQQLLALNGLHGVQVGDGDF